MYTSLLYGPGIPDAAFDIAVPDLFNQEPNAPEIIPMKKIDLERSTATITFLQELCMKQDELLVAMGKVIEAIEVGQGDGQGSPAWTTVQESVARDYDNILKFCQAGLDKLLVDYPVEGEANAITDSGTIGRGNQALPNEPVGNDGEAE